MQTGFTSTASDRPSFHYLYSVGIRYIFKATFDIANRSSGKSFRSPGPDEGLKILQEVGQSFGEPVLTDIHESCQAAAAAQVIVFICHMSGVP